MIRACIDTNVWISGLFFSGPPSEILTLARKRKFQVVLSPFILEELERNLVDKFELKARTARNVTYRIGQVADLYNPAGTIRIVPNTHADNLILETALLGKAKYLVTGDKKHLLPLKVFRNIKILDSSAFLQILKPK